MKRSRGRQPDFDCPHCGASVGGGALSCPSCGSDASTGWSEDADEWSEEFEGYDNVDESAPRAAPGAGMSRNVVIAVVLLIAILVLVLGGAW